MPKNRSRIKVDVCADGKPEIFVYENNGWEPLEFDDRPGPASLAFCLLLVAFREAWNKAGKTPSIDIEKYLIGGPIGPSRTIQQAKGTSWPNGFSELQKAMGIKSIPFKRESEKPNSIAKVSLLPSLLTPGNIFVENGSYGKIFRLILKLSRIGNVDFEKEVRWGKNVSRNDNGLNSSEEVFEFAFKHLGITFSELRSDETSADSDSEEKTPTLSDSDPQAEACHDKIRKKIEKIYKKHLLDSVSVPQSISRCFDEKGALVNAWCNSPIPIDVFLEELLEEITDSRPEGNDLKPLEQLVGGFVCLAVDPGWIRQNLAKREESAIFCNVREFMGTTDGDPQSYNILECLTKALEGELALLERICAKREEHVPILCEHSFAQTSSDRQVEFVGRYQDQKRALCQLDKKFSRAKNFGEISNAIKNDFESSLSGFKSKSKIARKKGRPYTLAIDLEHKDPKSAIHLLKAPVDKGGLALDNLFIFQTDEKTNGVSDPEAMLDNLIEIRKCLHDAQ